MKLKLCTLVFVIFVCCGFTFGPAPRIYHIQEYGDHTCIIIDQYNNALYEDTETWESIYGGTGHTTTPHRFATKKIAQQYLTQYILHNQVIQ